MTADRHLRVATAADAVPSEPGRDGWAGVPCGAPECDLPATCVVATIPRVGVNVRTSAEACAQAGRNPRDWPDVPACHDHACDALSDALHASRQAAS